VLRFNVQAKLYTGEWFTFVTEENAYHVTLFTYFAYFFVPNLRSIEERS
jgi:hypothetical protein